MSDFTDEYECAGKDPDERRRIIHRILTRSETGWETYANLRRLTGMDTGSVNHHARVLVREGAVAIGFLHLDGAPGRPPRVAIDIDRLPDLADSHLTLPPGHPESYDKKGKARTNLQYEVDVTDVPRDYLNGRIGPISQAFAEMTNDEIIAGVGEHIARALLADLLSGKIVLTVAKAPSSKKRAAT